MPDQSLARRASTSPPMTAQGPVGAGPALEQVRREAQAAAQLGDHERQRADLHHGSRRDRPSEVLS